MLMGVCASCKKDVSEPNDSNSSVETTDTSETTDNSGTTDDNGTTDNGGITDGDKEPDKENPPVEDKTVNADIITMKSFETTLMSFNIKTNNYPGEREDEVAASIVKYNAGVVCMQEVQKEQADYLSQKLPERYEIVWNYRDTADGEGLGIAYDSSVWTLESRDCFWLSETPDVKSKGWGARYYRICVNILLKHNETGAMLNVFDIHLDHEVEAARNNGMKLILEKVATSEYPCFVAGDFNTKESGAAYAYTAELLQDCRKVASDSDSGATYQNWGANSDDNADKMIDFCFVSRDLIKPSVFKICRDKYGENNDQFISDHYAIRTTVTIGYREYNYPDATENGFDADMVTVAE